jgi:M6 family metalloprotease-like protein
LMGCLAAGVVAALLLMGSVRAAPLMNVPVTIEQPDGQKLELFASGDEFYNWVHDENGFTVVRDPTTGYVEYAILQDGRLVPSGHRVGTVDPRSVGLVPNANLPPERMQEVRRMSAMGPESAADVAVPAPTSGMIHNVVIFIRFSDESEFTDAISTYEQMFNNAVAGGNSMYNYFREVSYNALTISTTFYPVPTDSTVVSYQDSQPRAYYQPYDAATNPIGYADDIVAREREHALLKNATDAVSSEIPVLLNLDGDGDGDVDNVCYVVYGGPGAWADLLWPHKWALWTDGCETYINGKQVWTYNFQLQASLAASGVGVLCHEMFHSLGAPDLYHYSHDWSDPVGPWDLMEWNFNPPQHMGAYMKHQYGGWIGSIPEISGVGTYTLNPLTSATGQCYKIPSNNSPTEFFVVEYRRDTGTFEGSLPGSGLIVHRINASVLGGNRDGPPDEVYVYRPGGTLLVNGDVWAANFSAAAGRTAINDSTTNPTSFLTDGSAGGLDIWDVGPANDTISFKLGHAPEIDVQRPAATSIVDGGIDDLGTLTTGVSTAIVYTVANTGTTALTLTGATGSSYTNCGSFAVNTAMPLDVPAGAAATLSVAITPTAAGAFAFDIDIANNDSDEGTYDIAVQGIGDPPGPPPTAAVFRVTSDGTVLADSTVHAKAFVIDGAADVAEWVSVSGPADAGAVVELDPDNPGAYRLSSSACSPWVAGVISTEPGVVLGHADASERRALLALVGIVPTHVNDEGGPILPGDLLVSSSTPGRAMRWDGSEPCPCALVGKALEPMTDETGLILVLLTSH